MYLFMLMLFITCAVVVFVAMKCCTPSVTEHFFFFNKMNNERDDAIYIKRLNDVAHVVYPLKRFDIRCGKKSYTVNKSTIYICLRDPRTGDMYRYDVLLYVMLHEMAHAISTSYSEDHNDEEFSNNFQMLLGRARTLGLLTVTVNVPSNYCGL